MSVVREGFGGLVAALVALLLVMAMPGSASIARAATPSAMPGQHAAGTIVIDTSQRRLYVSLGNGRAVSYPVAVGREGRQWRGATRVTHKVVGPSWRPTARMLRENPRLPHYVGPGPRNPMGTHAIYLGVGKLRIHGTNAPGSIGRAASNGCFRMFNGHVADLYSRVRPGARVIVTS